MQAKGLIRLFVIVLLLVCAYHLSFSFFTYRIEGRAEEYAQEQVKLPAYANLHPDTIAKLIPDFEARYLDSVYNTTVLDLWFSQFTYGDLKKSQLGLGLDLSGGMSVVLQVSMDELLVVMSDDSKDPAFLAALEEARAKQKTANTDFITLFADAYAKQPNKKPLATLFATPANADKIKYNDSDEKVIASIREEANGAFAKTVEIVRTRVDGLGVANPNINEQTITQRIEIELPGIKNPNRARELLQATAQLEFWETWENAEVSGGFDEANEVVREELGYAVDSSETTTSTDTTATVLGDSAVAATDGTLVDNTDTTTATTPTDDTTTGTLSSLSGDTGTTLAGDSATLEAEDADEMRKKYPLYGSQYSLIQPNIVQTEEGGGYSYGEGSVVGYSYGTDREKVDAYFANPQISALFPANIKFLWGAKMIRGTSLYALHAIKTETNTDEAPVGGSDVADAQRISDPVTGLPTIRMIMSSTGAQKWKKLSSENAPKDGKPGRVVAIVMDNKVYTAPRVQGVLSTESVITGDFTIREAEDLASVIRSGKLPARAIIVEEAVVGSTMGKEAIEAGLYSMLVAFVLVLCVMLFFYNRAGWVANAALLLNLFLILGTMASLGATLTMPGIAGLVLTIGMAVDANVIIFERIKEELAKGKGLITAISDGFSKSYSSIIDANVTTLLTGIILYYFGVGPIRGFAIILIIGIISSFITAVLVSRLIIDRRVSRGGKINFFTSFTKNFLANTSVKFIEKRKYSYILSIAIVVIGLVSALTRGFELGVDFQGGRSYQIRFDQPVDLQDVRESLAANLEKASTSVKTIGDASLNQLKIVTSYHIAETSPQADSAVNVKVYEAVKGFYAKEPTLKEFQSGQYTVAAFKTGPSIASDIRTGAIYATLFSFLVIFLYVLLRFRKREFAIASLITTIHDIMVVISLFTIFKGILPFSLEIDQNFIAAILTIVGYSINDTVIVFDRIREYLTENPSKRVGQIANNAINSTLSRTSMTAFTTILVVLILFIFGGEVIRGFAFALLIGIGFGTYSSIFIAAPLVVDIEGLLNKNKETKEIKA